MSNDLDARRAAHVALSAMRRGRTLDVALNVDGLETRDRAFARNLVATTMRRLGQIDDAIVRYVEHGVRPEAAQDLLRLGAAQLLFLQTPAHAAVDTSVRLAERLNLTKQKGLINAVLRRIGEARDAILADQDAARLNTPPWLWKSWVAAYGDADARAIAEANLTEAPLDITLKPGLDRDEWATKLEATKLDTGSLRRDVTGDVRALPGFDDGLWWVQDAAAALPATLFGDVRGKRVADLCAAPGGKTAQLAAAGANVTALDKMAPRLARVRANLDRLGLNAELVEADARSWRSSEKFDAILLDAPCTATGAIRRNPDVLTAKNPRMVAELTRQQDALIDAAVVQLVRGGTLIYCVCSLQPEEGEQRIESALQRHPGLDRRPIRAAEIGGWHELLDRHGQIRSTPAKLRFIGGLDGFFVARLALA
ncbi:RsmB/NOP family class I SAM-dependent RNA methyltransferase [Roseiterribacter gracilis]|uniref:MFS transporter n=1 Tax=Roseiterribacter gracilis TaxID=2812848 RepID=A0A8S8XCJ1_9PROT|nr:MFS transporter [Rhodospirillales bacterium TMPK1]